MVAVKSYSSCKRMLKGEAGWAVVAEVVNIAFWSVIGDPFLSARELKGSLFLFFGDE